MERNTHKGTVCYYKFILTFLYNSLSKSLFVHFPVWTCQMCFLSFYFHPLGGSSGLKVVSLRQRCSYCTLDDKIFSSSGSFFIGILHLQYSLLSVFKIITEASWGKLGVTTQIDGQKDQVDCLWQKIAKYNWESLLCCVLQQTKLINWGGAKLCSATLSYNFSDRKLV